MSDVDERKAELIECIKHISQQLKMIMAGVYIIIGGGLAVLIAHLIK